MTDRPLILLSNDDGIQATGLTRLAEGLAELAEICVVAPDGERSATSHAISLDRPLRVSEPRPGWFAVSGTPVDCVYLGVLELLPRRPDLIVAGINHGVNLGSDIFYSGTVAAAIEGAIRGVPAVAFSREWETSPDLGPAIGFARALVAALLVEGLPPNTLLNVNVPCSVPRGYSVTRLGRRVYREQVEVRKDLRGKAYYWIGGPALPDAPETQDTDCAALRDGLVSVTPLDLDLTSRDRSGIWRGRHLGGFANVHSRDAGGAAAIP